MKTVHIPKCESPMWECNVNNVVYRYPQDTDQTVPDAVASIIDSSERAIPKQDKTDPATWLVYKQGGWNTDDTGSGGGGGSCGCGVVAHLSSEAVRITIDGDQYSAYPLDKTYKDVTENVATLLDEGDGYTEVYHLGLFSDGSSQFTGYPYTVQFFNPNGELILYAETETGTLYFIPQE